MNPRSVPNAGPTRRTWWIVGKREIHDSYTEDSRHTTFHDAMEALAKKDGEWRADWTLETVYKGDFMVTHMTLPPESNKEAPKADAR